MNNYRGGMYIDGFGRTFMVPNNDAYANQWGQNQPLYRPEPQNYPVIVGKIVNGLDDIRPNEVPNDGSIAVFPQSDGGCIYVKYLTGDGRINTVKYNMETPEIPNGNQNGMSSGYASLDQRLASIEKKLDKLFSGNKRRRDRTYYKKEGSVNDSVRDEQSDDRKHDQSAEV